MPKHISELGDHLGYWLRMVSNHISHSFAERLGDQGVTVAEWVFLRALYGRPPTPPSRLASEMGMTRGAITKLADRLLAKSLIVRVADADDGRAQTLALTDAGTALVPGLATLADENEATAFACLSDSERLQLRNTLQQLVAHHRLTLVPTL